MAVKLAQTERTKNSVTFSVSGITTDRRTWVWVETLAEWVILSEATVADGITDIETDGGDNGTITVYFDSAAIKSGYKVWAFCVDDYSIAEKKVISESDILYTVLFFDYENTTEKVIGKSIDLTVEDFKNMGMFAVQLFVFLGEYQSDLDFYYYYDDVFQGYDIYADYLLLPAKQIYNAANKLTIKQLPLRAFIMKSMDNIIDNVRSGSDFKAEYFNDMYYAINQFNMNV